MYCHASAVPWDLPHGPLPSRFNRLFRQPAEVPPLRPRVAMMASAGILTGCPSDTPPLQRVLVRPRLTLIRLALIRKPWSFGEGVSRPLYRYLYLHLLFHTLQNTSRYAFDAEWNAPLPILTYSTASVDCFIPDYYPRRIPRLVSCYALFK